MADTPPRTAQPTARPDRAVALTRTPADAFARASVSAESPAHDADLIVIGGGPAGCAAARTAAGVGMRTILIEPDALCRNLYRIPALNNVLGGWTDGPALADAVTAELRSTDLCRLELGREVSGVHAHDEHITVTLDTGARLTAPHVVVATGVGPLQPHDVGWITAPDTRPLPPLWRATARDAEARTLLVLGGDRPVGTFLRARPDTDTRLLVAYPEADAYKIEEIRDDPRVTLLPTARLILSVSVSGRATADILSGDGGRRTVTADAAYLSIGNAPTAPPGDLVRGADGYCPPGEQHPRVIVAGDLRAARFQRIMTALGSGSEAALRAYYATRDLSAGR
ncbi:FAD-dependent oxidoreductase [Streptomyces zaomyceticus]|uniref:FAD-dependent oxidoreductase n=1 Tax=Streptomyces zaomyceticus TaxID=68286 RepID=UPI0033A779D4